MRRWSGTGSWSAFRSFSQQQPPRLLERCKSWLWRGGDDDVDYDGNNDDDDDDDDDYDGNGDDGDDGELQSCT